MTILSSREERELVHSTYDKIAEHFSATRYSVWPDVTRFLRDIQPGSLILDNGCGNGKNCNRGDCVFIGTDTCHKFLEITGERTEVIDTPAMNSKMLMFRDNCFDYVLSIAVIHHIYTPGDRLEAMKEIARVLRVGGKALVSVWSKHKHYEYGDNIIPWNLQARHSRSKGDETYPRYYRLFRREEFIELINLVTDIEIETINECYNNFFATIVKKSSSN